MNRVSLRSLSRSQIAKCIFLFLGLAVFAALLYWLLPVAIQSRLSADHVRRVFGESDASPVVGASLSSLWAGIVSILKLTGLVDSEQMFATVSALSGWIAVAAVGVLAFVVPWPAVVLVALAPAVLWSSVVPNGTALTFLFLALVGFTAKPSISYGDDRRRWLIGAVLEGVVSALTPAAWVLVILRALRTRKVTGQPKYLRLIFFFVGFTLPASTGILFDALGGQAASFAAFPVMGFLRAVPLEDALGAGFVIAGGGGELALGLLASLSFVVAIMLSVDWRSRREARWLQPMKWILLTSPFILFAIAGHPKSWRLAHPGWNTVLEDFSLNVGRSFSAPVVAIVRSSTEEAGLRYADELLSKTHNVIGLRPINIFEPSTQQRVHARENKFDTAEAAAAVKSPTAAKGMEAFVESLLVPNLQRGVQFWLDTIPDRNMGLEISFLGNGVRVRRADGPTKFLTERESVRAMYVRARPGAQEYLAGPSLEIQMFERYATYHLAMAHVIEKEKRTTDWEHRARGEYYAALKKVEWLRVPYQKVCVDPVKENEAEAKKEPLEICSDVRWFHQ